MRLPRAFVGAVVVLMMTTSGAACGGGGSHGAAPSKTTTTVSANAPAHIVTWTLTSRFVDPAKVGMASPPAAIAPRPNALRVNVLLPAGYDGTRPFPVLYLLHGAQSAYDYWAAPERGDILHTAQGFDGIIVMPEGGTAGFYANWWNNGQRANPAWESFFFNELIPQVERRLKILPGRQYHAIAGLSMGGDGALFLASQLPGYFGAAASFSGTVSMQRWQAANDGAFFPIFGDPVAQHFYLAGHNPTDLVTNLANTRIYVSVGDGVSQTPADRTHPDRAAGEAKMALQAHDFLAAAQAANVPVTFRPHAGIHDWPYWRRDLQDAIRWGFFVPVPDPPNHWTYRTVAQTGDAFGYHYRFQDPPNVVENLSLAAGVLHGAGAGHVTITSPTEQTFTTTMPFTHQ
jgi:S-formylglutathione hydrolase FrmB